jgi:hypothetical protein
MHESNANGFSLFTHANAGFKSPVIAMYKSRGTQALPTAIKSGDTLGFINHGGYDGTTYAEFSVLFPTTSEDWTATTHGFDVTIQAVTLGTSSPVKMIWTGAARLGLNDGAPAVGLSVLSNAQIGGTAGTTAPANGLAVSTVITVGTGYRIGGTAPAGHYLRGNGTNYVDGTIQAGDLPAGTGTVTSVSFATGGGASDALYTISGSPITTSGTITETLNTQTQKTFLAGPTSGAAATPTFRTIASTDLPAGTGTVTNFTAGTLSPLFTTSVATSTTTPALTFSLTNAAGGTVFGNNTTSSAAPAYTIAPVLGIPGTSTGTIALASSTASGLYTITAPANAATPTLTLPTTSNVLAGQIAGDGTIFASSLVVASAAGTITLPTPQNQTANTVFAGPTSGGAAAPTFRALVAADIPSGTVIWNNIGNATGALTLANANFATTFNQTSAVNWTWANTSAASSGSAALISTGTMVSGSGSSASVTISTVGATLLVAVLMDFSASNPTISDNQSNTWNYLTTRLNGSTRIRIAYAFGITTNASHQFTVSGTFAGGIVYSFSGTLTGASVFDVENGANGPLASPFQTGSITPALNDIVISGFANPDATTTASINSGFATAIRQVGSGETGAASYLLNAANSPLNPTWTMTGSTNNSVAIASFKTAGGLTFQNSPILNLTGQYWNGSASATDSWAIENIIGIGPNGTSTLTFTHTGSSGSASISAPNAILTGLVTTYNNILTVSNGIPSEIVAIDLTAKSAAITATTAYATIATGMYRVSWSATITTAASTSSVLGGTNGFQILYTSPTDSVVKTTVAGNSVTSAANTTGTAVGGTEVVYAKTGTNIQYQYDYTSVGVTAMVYELHLKVEAM